MSVLIPLYFRPPAAQGRRRAQKGIAPVPGLTLESGGDSVLLSRDNFEQLLDAIGDRGLPRFHLYDSEAEAHAAALLLSHEEARTRGVRSATEVGRLRDGEGVLMILHRDRPVLDDQLEMIDSRGAGSRTHTAFGSWELTHEECESALNRPPGEGREDLALALVGKLSRLPAELIRGVQIGLERVPGAYMGFVSVSPEEIRQDYRLEGVDPALLPDTLIQPFLDRASAKAELGDALNEAVDATVERLLEARPDLATTGSDLEEPEI